LIVSFLRYSVIFSQSPLFHPPRVEAVPFFRSTFSVLLLLKLAHREGRTDTYYKRVAELTSRVGKPQA